jgi:hypothetical protein
MKILVLANIVFFSQFSFVYAAKPFCEQTTNEFSLGLAVGFIGASFIGYKIGKGEMSFDVGEKEFTKIGKSLQSKLINFCSVQGNKDKNLSHMDILKLVVTDSNFGKVAKSKLRGIDKFFILLSDDFKKPQYRNCFFRTLKDKEIKVFEGWYDKIDKLMKSEGVKKPSDKMFDKVFGDNMNDIIEFNKKMSKKCKSFK